MDRRIIAARLLLTVAAATYLFGALMHAKAFFGSASGVISASSMKIFFSDELKVLWLADSTTLAGLAFTFGLIAARPAFAAKPVILCLAWIPAATTGLLYLFLGPFYAAHMLLAATLMVIASALILPVPRICGREATFNSETAPASLN